MYIGMEQAGVAVTLQTYVLEVPGSNPSWDTDILTWVSWFSSGPPGKCQCSTSIRAWPISSKAFPVHYSLVNLQFDTVQSEIQKASLNKVRKSEKRCGCKITGLHALYRGKLVGVGSKWKVIDHEPFQTEQDWTRLSLSVGLPLSFVWVWPCCVALPDSWLGWKSSSASIWNFLWNWKKKLRQNVSNC
jgi:hypothetical protein